MFEDFRKKHADIPELQRPDRYGQLDFTTDLIRQFADRDVHADAPLLSKKRVFTTHSIIPVMTTERKNCKKVLQTETERAENKCMGCETYLCFQSDRNCSVFMSVSVIHCNVCAYVAFHFQWLAGLNIMKSVIPGIVKACQCYNKRNSYCILPCGVGEVLLNVLRCQLTY